MRFIAVGLIIAMLCACAGSPPPRPLPPQGARNDYSDDIAAINQFNRDYETLLGKIVTKQRGLVDYKALAGEREALGKLVQTVAETRHFDTNARRLSYLINAYNLMVLRAIADRRAGASVNPGKGFFDKQEFTVIGETITLDNLRDRWIRPLGDARIHMALVYGAMGSPPLRRDAYTADRLDDQLNDQSERFVNDGVHISVLGPTLLASPLFDWFKEDFAKPPFGGTLGFIALYADPNSPLATLVAGKDKPLITWQPFNWALNTAE